MGALRKNWIVLLVGAAVFAASWAQSQGARDAADTTCENLARLTDEVDTQLPTLVEFRDGMRVFVIETRRARSNKSGSSYDPQFVRVIDGEVTPRLNKVRPVKLPRPKC